MAEKATQSNEPVDRTEGDEQKVAGTVEDKALLGGDGVGAEEESKTLLTGEKDPDEGEAGAPEKYEQFKVPEGFALDEDILTEFSDAARTKGLDQETAQKFIDVGVKLAQKVAKGLEENWKEVRKTWRKDLESDGEFGGTNLRETVKGANRVLAKYGTKPLSDWLQASGAGDNPDLIRLLSSVDKATREDTFHGGGQPVKPSGEEAALRGLYPSMFQT